jgi:hypothetical protein
LSPELVCWIKSHDSPTGSRFAFCRELACCRRL